MEILTSNQQRFASVIQCINKELHDKGYINCSDEGQLLEDDSPVTKAMMEHRQLLTEMRSQNFDVIRFATYRTACKLRFIQKKTNLNLVDIWNIIEAFRENGLNVLEQQSELNASRLESVLSSVFYQLNKRLPTSQQIDADKSTTLMLYWLLSAYDRENNGRIRVFSVKVALSHMCSGKLMDKLRYIFTQLSDSSGCLVRAKFEEYLQDVLALPTAVFEGPSFGYNETSSRACFEWNNGINVNDFLNVLMNEPGPQCLMWLPILNRMSQVENVLHPVQCEGCNRESFMGFRYKCQRCYKYQLCQDCFWRGRTSGNHTNDHEMKEYTSYKSPAKEMGHNLKKSFHCVPNKPANKLPHFHDNVERKIDLSYIVPPTPIPVHNPPQNGSISHSLDISSLDSGSAPRSPSKINGSLDSTRIDDEHRLIARYAARLAADAHNAKLQQEPCFFEYSAIDFQRLELEIEKEKARSPTELNFTVDTNRAQRDLIAQLEAKNREIMREIHRLRLEQESQVKNGDDPGIYNPTLVAELRLLRQRKDELESRMQTLQESRKELMVQLESLMKLLKNHGSPRSTPNTSPRSRSGPPSFSPPVTKGSSPSTPLETLAGVGGDVKQAFHQPPSAAVNARNLRNDLLVAADSVTSAMSCLVKELNSDCSLSDEEENGLDHKLDGVHPQISEDVESWQDEIKRRLDQETDFLAQLRARRQRSTNSSRAASDTETDQYIPTDDGESYVRTESDDRSMPTDDGESYIRTDEESFMRTDEEDNELYDNNPKGLSSMTSSRYSTDDGSFLQTDDESYIRTDDDEGGNASDWEESLRRWVNR